MLNEILNSHAIKNFDSQNEIENCKICNSGIQWRAYEASPWRCIECHEPPNQSLARFVRMIVGDEPDRSWLNVRPGGKLERATEPTIGPIEFDEIPKPVWTREANADYIKWMRNCGVDELTLARIGSINHVPRGRKSRTQNQTDQDRK